jgi:hypothetical protein
MFIIVTVPWPVPSANAELAGVQPAASAAGLPDADALAETSTLRPARLEEMVCWTWRERLRLRWFRLRLTAGGIYRVAGRPREPRLKVR